MMKCSRNLKIRTLTKEKGQQRRRYIAMNKSYQTIMKQLGDYIPKKQVETKPQSDGFEEFVATRD